MSVSLDDIERARLLIQDNIVRTPLIYAPRLSARFDCRLFLKLETMQATGSFKDRGSLNRLLHLDDEQRRRGVVAMSAGNHAQGVAYHARRLGVPAKIVMPSFAPFSKVERTRSYGAEVILEGDTLDASAVRAREIVSEEGRTFIHPYDDDHIIAGQGSIGLEIMEDCPDVDAVIVPIGGGGVISGTATAVQSLRPGVEVYGVESDRYPSMSRAIAGEAPSFGEATIADGIAVKVPGERTRPIVEERVREIFLCGDDDFERAIFLLLEEQKVVAEGAGAAGVAALLCNGERFRGRRVVVVVCGGNIDSRMLASVLARCLMYDSRILRLRIRIVDRPGEMSRLSGVIAACGSNILEIHHQRLFADIPAKEADIDAVVETSGVEHGEVIRGRLEEAGYRVRILKISTLNHTL
ncbi:MAG: threonine ammonia-lyase [Alphaproteobacteria bacterium]|nr:threonine ammonia-lyase [Alphaproteobacteria bacterium]MDA7982535.1 threonine ammonia-lyase [Alphaproteobacteria bacterium]MDA7988091.1 threonine ammonia-lyase [Alphaproteobacteria bacterium]MDA8008658.1 threonine ammonia-lyase [Alphaproteobacteria bacterium]